ncbi:MAG: hypothetical protein GY832_08405 [Chloroflexi bacterium]|nr:hypothetical protein [Chloroflexota bacterium]
MIPNNVADAAAAVKDGELGLIEQVYIGDLLVSALTGLSGSREKIVTEKPIEEGFAHTYAAVHLPIVLSLDICLANPDYSIEAGATAAMTGDVSSLAETHRDKRDRLFQIYDDDEIVGVTTHENSYPSMIIQSITPWYDVEENWDAYFATVVVKEIIETSSGTDGGLIDKAKDAVGGM